ncbi:MAG: ABC transporter substrate-binding protein [Phyllobacterium sp.]
MKKTALLLASTLMVLSAPAFAQEQTEIRIATEGAYPPFNLVAPDGTLKGFDVDIAKALCEEMKAKCTIVAQDWDGIITGLQAKKYDAVVASMTVTDERKKQVAFTDRYYSSRLSVAVPKDSALTSTEASAMDGKVVGAQSGTTQGYYTEDTYAKAGADAKLYPTQDEANLDLKNGRLDALVSDKFPMMDWLKADGADCCKLLGDIAGTESDTAIAVRLEDNELRENFNKAIAAIRANGTYEKIMREYFSFDIY